MANMVYIYIYVVEIVFIVGHGCHWLVQLWGGYIDGPGDGSKPGVSMTSCELPGRSTMLSWF